jgi:uncharacterized protein YkwD
MKKTQKKTKVTRPSKPQKKHSQDFLKVYWPYLPLLVFVFFGMFFGVGLPGRPPVFSSNGILAYATEMSTSGLLSATNTQRAQNGGLPALTLNSKLASAAQAKANDMVARNYWSHNTPDGQEPWVFMDAAGYEYQKAGENLAYGFATSADTVTGWMNSPGHRANILDSAYKEVGFGFANASNFVSTGQETVVVAMYGNPLNDSQQAAAPASAPSATAGASKASTPAAAPSAAQATPQDTTVVEDTAMPADATLRPLPAERVNQPITSESPVPAAQPATRITKLQSITNGYAPWSAAALSTTVLIVTILWALKHAIVVKRVLLDGEKFILHHPLLDVGVMALVALAVLLSRSSGVVK